MTSKEILENNRLIAEFMSLPFDGEYYQNSYKVMSFFGPLEYSRTLDDLRFNTSWDWLIPVVEKIESIHSDFHGYFGVYISSNGCTIQGTRLNPGVVNAYYNENTLETKLKSTYQSVVEFIKWYDENKEK